jgi:L-threonate 2-dehydrogenase
MAPVVAIIAPGNMGAAIAGCLTGRGVTVRTSVASQNEASAERARGAGMLPVDDRGLAASDFILSVVPPGEAFAVAQHLASALEAADPKPCYVDCNAVNPATVARIGAVITETGCSFVDGGIIGPPPAEGRRTVLYVAGADACLVAALGNYGLTITVLDGPIGAASALKMSYAGITKGFTALGAAMMLAADRADASQALHAELAQSQPALLTWLARQVPAMYPKAYRWIAEMEEVAGFVAVDPAAEAIYRGTAALYRRLADDVGVETATLSGFCTLTER